MPRSRRPTSRARPRRARADIIASVIRGDGTGVGPRDTDPARGRRTVARGNQVAVLDGASRRTEPAPACAAPRGLPEFPGTILPTIRPAGPGRFGFPTRLGFPLGGS